VRVERQPAWVLHARPWRETSLLVEVFTREHGRVGLVARGVRGPRAQPLRAALQPLQAITLDFQLRGELAQLRQAEALGPGAGLQGDALMAGFYLGELVLRLAPRLDPLPGLFDAYGAAVAALAEAAGPADLGWVLRGFERRLLEELGIGLDWAIDATGEPVDPAARYRLDPEDGALRDRGAARAGTLRGATLLAFAEGERPDAEGLRELRDGLRGLLAHHLGPRGLASWGMLGELARVAPAAPSAAAPAQGSGSASSSSAASRHDANASDDNGA